MELMTQSRLRAYRRCARLESLQYVQGWRPVADSEALAFGTLWHAALEVWWQTLSLDDAMCAVAGAAKDTYTQAKLDVMIEGYHATWTGQQLETLAVEEAFRAPLLNPATMAASRTYELAGKIDARVIVRNGSVYDGQEMIVEHKTTSEDIAPGADYWAKLAMDPQLSVYTIGAESLGHPTAGAIYDVARKPMLRPAKATAPESRKYTKDGKLYANQREVDETPDEFRARLREAVFGDLSAYFARQIIPRTESQIRDFLFDAWEQSRTMRESHLAQRAPRNPDACHAFGRCPFWSCCADGMDPAEHPDLFRRIEDVHPELTADEAA